MKEALPLARLEPAKLVVLFAVLVLVGFTFTKHRFGTNVRSRFITVERLVDAGTMAHDESPIEPSVDAIVIEGRRYSSKPPNYTLVMAAQAWVLKAMTGWRVSEHPRFYLWMLVLLNQVVLYAVVLLLAWRLVAARTADPWVRGMFVAAMSLGSVPYGYAVTLNNHTPAAAFLFIAFYLLVTLRHQGRGGWARYFGVGFLAGLACTYELTAGAFAAVFVLVAFLHDRRGGSIAAAAAVLPVIPTLATYYVMSGSIAPFYVQRDLYDYAGSYWREPTGYDAASDGLLVYAFNALLGHHGLFSLSPLLALGVVGLARGVRDRAAALRGEYVAIAAASACVIVYIVGTTNNYGGNALGMRWFAQFMPLWTVAALPVLERLRESRRGRGTAYALLAVSVAVVGEALVHSTFQKGGWVLGLTKVLGGAG